MRAKSIVLLLIAVALVACAGVAENVAERAVERAAEASGGSGDVDIDLNEDGVSAQVKTEDGSQSIQIGGNAKVPDGFPIPIADGGTVISAVTQESGDTTNYAVSLQYPAGSYDDVVAFYEDWASGLDGDTQTSTTSGTIESTQWTNLEEQVVVVVAQVDEMVNVNLTSGLG